MLYFLFFNIQK